jgi:hypothetical protein
MGGACSTNGYYEKWILKFWLDNLKGRDHSDDLGLDCVKIITGVRDISMTLGVLRLRMEETASRYGRQL